MLVMAYFGVWFGAGLITRDFGAGTLDVLLAAPISRTRILALPHRRPIHPHRGGRWRVPGRNSDRRGYLGPEIDLSAFDLLLVHVQMLLFTLAVAGGGLLLATLILQPGRTYGLAAGIIVIMFVMLIVADIASGVEWLEKDQFVRLLEPCGPVGDR